MILPALLSAWCVIGLAAFELEIVGKNKVFVTNLTHFENFLESPYAELLKVTKYYDNEKQIQWIGNLNYIKYILLSDIGQNEIPIFENIAKFTTLNLAKNDIKIVNNKGFSSTSVRHIFLHKNQITKIENGSFGENVRWLNLACNNITEISKNWFKNPASLRRLNLGGNFLTYVPKNMFLEFKDLNDINLSFNLIWRIESGAFAGRSQYDWLFLESNDLVNLNYEIFAQPKVKIDNFNIADNKLIYLPDQLLGSLSVLNSAVIYGNPWQCPCYETIRNTFNQTRLDEEGSRCEKKDMNEKEECSVFRFDEDFIDMVKLPEEHGKFCNRTFDENLEM